MNSCDIDLTDFILVEPDRLLTCTSKDHHSLQLIDVSFLIVRHSEKVLKITLKSHMNSTELKLLTLKHQYRLDLVINFLRVEFRQPNIVCDSDFK